MVIKLPPFRRIGTGFQYAVFRLPKGRLLHDERPPFARQKTAFYKGSDYQAVTKATSYGNKQGKTAMPTDEEYLQYGLRIYAFTA